MRVLPCALPLGLHPFRRIGYTLVTSDFGHYLRAIATRTVSCGEGPVVRSGIATMGPALLLLMCLVGAQPARAQPATLRGFVTDQSNGEALELVNIALLGANSQVKGGVTNRMVFGSSVVDV